MPRDTNPMPALSVLKGRAVEELEKEGFAVLNFDVIPSDHADGVHRCRIVVRQKPVDPEVVKAEAEFEAIVGDPTAPFAPPADDSRAEKARENLKDLQEKLKRQGGIL